MRRLLIALIITFVPSFAMAAHSGGGHMSGGHSGGSGGHVGGWGGHVSSPMAGRMSGWAGNVGGRNHGTFHGTFAHHRHGHRHSRFFFVGGPWVGGYDYYGYDCWRLAQTPWGLRRVWVCDYY